MDFDPRSIAVLVLFVGAVLYGKLRYYRPGATVPPRWERTIVPIVAVAAVIGLYLWQIVDP